MSSYNKIAEDLAKKCWEEHALNGFWKEANFEKHDHGTSFSLFEHIGQIKDGSPKRSL